MRACVSASVDGWVPVCVAGMSFLFVQQHVCCVVCELMHMPPPSRSRLRAYLR